MSFAFLTSQKQFLSTVFAACVVLMEISDLMLEISRNNKWKSVCSGCVAYVKFSESTRYLRRLSKVVWTVRLLMNL